MKTTIVGFPRIGAKRELKFITEQFFRHEIDENQLHLAAKQLRQQHWQLLKSAGIDLIPSNDFSLYDQLLDTACLFNIIPSSIASLALSPTEQYFALARGYQGKQGDHKALTMKKWFNTNYHYLVPEFSKQTDVKLVGDKPVAEYLEAKALGIETCPVLIGPFTLLKLAKFTAGVVPSDFHGALIGAYSRLLQTLYAQGCQGVQLDEPALVLDLTHDEQADFSRLYTALFAQTKLPALYLQTYFGDVRDVYTQLTALPFAGIGLDFVEGKRNLELVKQYGFPQDKILIAGVVNGKNIWRNHYAKTLTLLKQLPVEADKLYLSSSCSLLHVPFSVEQESTLSSDVKNHFAFAKEKLTELVELKESILQPQHAALKRNDALFLQPRIQANPTLATKLQQLRPEDFTRKPLREEREHIQQAKFHLPLLPTTTIGSFPQTKEVKQYRAQLKKGEINTASYDDFVKEKIKACIQWQEQAGFDVLVHGEFERNDMVEYFGENLSGYLFTQYAWVQSYGTRCVKPPIIWGDIVRTKPITVAWSQYAQSLTTKPVKGMLTGPVTILNWSFPREDISLKESTLQIALAIREEVLSLEESGIEIIQIDEAALREKLPLRKSDWQAEYLDWAIPAFRLVHSHVKPTTQIHTHMCYSQFTDIVDAIAAMDTDVISFEASRSALDILDSLREHHFDTQVGPGVYDIHSPRIPSVDEIKQTISKILAKLPAKQVWINPDCGLKTRGEPETQASLLNLIQATEEIRKEL